MSRSYKKHPGWSGRRDCTKIEKRAAARKVRKASYVPNGSGYKNLYNRWNIIDYNFRYYSRAELIRANAKWKHPYDRLWHGWMK